MATSAPRGWLGEAPPWFPWKAPLCAAVVFVAAVAWCAARAAEWAWLRPRRLGRALRAQGLRGTAYRPLAGDAPLADRLAREARSRPPLPPGCHAVVPRAMPLFHHAMEQHGKTSMTWSGPVPMVTIAEPELVRQVLSNKFGHFKKVGFGQLQRLLHNGVSSHEGDKWARHRRIIKPAFHLEKLKVGGSGWRWRGGRVAGDAAADGGRHLPRRVREQLPRGQEDLPAPGGAGAPRHAHRQQDTHPRIHNAADQDEPADEADRGGDRGDPGRDDREEGARAASRRGHRRRSPRPDAGVQHGAVQGRPRDDELRRRHGHVHRRRDRGVQDVLLRRHGDHVGAAHVDNDRALHAPGVAGPRQGGGAPGLRRRRSRSAAGLQLPRSPQNRDDGAVRGAEAVHAAAGGAPPDVQADGARRRQVPGGRDAGAAAAVDPPRQGRLGAGRRRVQAGEVRGGGRRGVRRRGPAAGAVLLVRRRAQDLRRAELRAAGGQDGARHGPAELRVRALAVLLARAIPRPAAEAGARRAGQAQEAPLTCLCGSILCMNIVCEARHRY